MVVFDMFIMPRKIFIHLVSHDANNLPSQTKFLIEKQTKFSCLQRTTIARTSRLIAQLSVAPSFTALYRFTLCKQSHWIPFKMLSDGRFVHSPAFFSFENNFLLKSISSASLDLIFFVLIKMILQKNSSTKAHIDDSIHKIFFLM